MPHESFGPTLDASGVLASRLLEFLANKLPSAQERLGKKRLDEARDLAEKNISLIDPENMKIARDKVLRCVLALPSVFIDVQRQLVLQKSG